MLRILELFGREVCKFLFLLFLNVCKQIFHISQVRISEKVKGVLMQDIIYLYMSSKIFLFNVKSSTYYFYMKKKILTDFQNCISIPLRKLSARAFHQET